MSNFDRLKSWNLSVPSVYEKYKPGEHSDSYEEIKKLKPVFSFEYLADRGEFSYNHCTVDSKDYASLFKALKDISDQTYETMRSEKHIYHFHDVKWEETSVSPSAFKKFIRRKDTDDVDDIEAYQFSITQKKRIVGFIYKSVFYIVLFDFGHTIYNGRLNGKKKSRKVK